MRFGKMYLLFVSNSIFIEHYPPCDFKVKMDHERNLSKHQTITFYHLQDYPKINVALLKRFSPFSDPFLSVLSLLCFNASQSTRCERAASARRETCLEDSPHPKQRTKILVITPSPPPEIRMFSTLSSS